MAGKEAAKIGLVGTGWAVKVGRRSMTRHNSGQFTADMVMACRMAVCKLADETIGLRMH